MKSQYSVKNSIMSFISSIISIIFVLISQSVFIKTLGIENSGLNGLFANVISFLNLFEFGIGSAIAFHLYKYTYKDKKEKIIPIIYYCKKIYINIIFIILGIGFLLIPFLQFFIKEVTVDVNIYLVYFLFLINTISTYVFIHKRILIYSYQKNYILDIIHILYIVIVNILQIIILIFTKNFYLYLIIKIICILLENIAVSIKADRDYPYLKDECKEISNKEKNDIISRVKALAIHKTAAFIVFGTDNILISSFFGLRDVGLYSNYHYIINAVYTLFQGIISSVGASVGIMLNEKDTINNYESYKKIKYLNSWIAIFSSIALLVLMEPFISLWLGREYLINYVTLVVLVINFYQSFMRITFNTYKDAAGIWIEDRIVPIIQAVLNLVFSIILLNFFGITGVFLGSIISSFPVWFYSYPKYVYKNLFNKSYKEYYLEMLREIIIVLLISCVSLLAINLISIDSLILSFVIKMIIIAIVPNTLYILVNKKIYLKYYINLLKNIIK